MLSVSMGASASVLGSASPRIAKLIAARSSSDFVPKISSTVGTDTPAACATARIDVAT